MDKFWKATTRMVAMPFRPKTNDVLALLNEARIALAMRPIDELPLGYTGASRSCPVSRSLSRMVGATGVSFDNEDRAIAVAAAWKTETLPAIGNSFVVVLPTILRRFIRDYDLGAYPSLTQKIKGPRATRTSYSPSLVDAA